MQQINQVLKKFNIPIKEVLIEKNLINKSHQLLENFKANPSKTLLVTDQNLVHIAKKITINFLCEILVLENPRPNLQIIKQIVAKGRGLTHIIGVGSGTINDLCKASSFELKIPYIIFTTAPSMNGYASSNASIKVKTHKTSIMAHLPMAIYGDIDVLKSAPKRLLRSGVGDSLCFSTCKFDWFLSHLILGTKFNQIPFDLLEPYLKKLFLLVEKSTNSDIFSDEIVKLLMKILIVSGLGMYICKGSYPASQAEHLVAHYLEIKYPQIAKLSHHGEQIAVTTLEIIDIQQKILQQKSLQIKSRKFTAKNVNGIFDEKLAKHFLKEISKKNVNSHQATKINADLEKNWPKYKKQLKDVFLEKEYILKIFKIFGVEAESKKIGIKKSILKESLNKAYLIRDRFTSLDLITLIKNKNDQ